MSACPSLLTSLGLRRSKGATSKMIAPRTSHVPPMAALMLAVGAVLMTSSQDSWRQSGDSRHDFHQTFATHLAGAKYIDLTHAIRPGMPIWPGFATPSVGPAKAVDEFEGFCSRGEAFSYGRQGFVATEVHLPTDQLGTQLDPPAHWSEFGATISDVPPTVSLRPLVVIDITAKVAQDRTCESPAGSTPPCPAHTAQSRRTPCPQTTRRSRTSTRGSGRIGVACPPAASSSSAPASA